MPQTFSSLLDCPAHIWSLLVNFLGSYEALRVQAVSQRWEEHLLVGLFARNNELFGKLPPDITTEILNPERTPEFTNNTFLKKVHVHDTNCVCCDMASYGSRPYAVSHTAIVSFGPTNFHGLYVTLKIEEWCFDDDSVGEEWDTLAIGVGLLGEQNATQIWKVSKSREMGYKTSEVFAPPVVQLEDIPEPLIDILSRLLPEMKGTMLRDFLKIICSSRELFPNDELHRGLAMAREDREDQYDCDPKEVGQLAGVTPPVFSMHCRGNKGRIGKMITDWLDMSVPPLIGNQVGFPDDNGPGLFRNREQPHIETKIPQRASFPLKWVCPN
eukprot:TRINITY_DN95043_c0_g1_i1.p1 TRINITY_DN95043_c0_g1~~TRINITY_DN95043_c0_g1_i1.p1  ORF type:complete len:327 (-),score=20.30 TRINITY_DN95043_c0_g1_i1:50-1030(-)